MSKGSARRASALQSSAETPEPGTAPAGEWQIRVAVSVLQNCPPELLRSWLVCEAYQRANPHFWPDNAAIGAQLRLARVTSTQRALLRLEDLGILAREELDGHNRRLRLVRRTWQPLSPADWSEMEAAAERKAAARRVRKAADA